MMRVATYMSRQVLVNRMNELQARLNETNTQVVTEKKSQIYSGIAVDSFRLVNFENAASRVQRFMDNNNVAQIRLSTMEESIQSSEQSLRDLRASLLDFMQRNPEDWNEDYEIEYSDLQNQAFTTMKDLEYFFNVNIDGRYLFSGSRTDIAPVKLPWDSLDEFQKVFDGDDVSFATTQAANLSEAKFSSTASMGTYTWTQNLTEADFGDLTFDDSADPDGQGTISSSVAGAFSDFAVGMSLTVGGGTPYDQTYTVTGVAADGSSITVDPVTGATTAAVVDAASNAATMTVEKPYGILTGAAGDFVTGSPLTSTTLGTLTFTPTNAESGTIVSDQAGAFSGLSIGMTLLTDTDTTGSGNPTQDGIYTITRISDDGRTITVEPPPPGNGGAAVVVDPSAADSTTIRLGIPDGTRVKLDGSTNNDRYYTVRWPTGLTGANFTGALAGDRIFTTPPFTAEGATAITVETESYYKGDKMEQTHRLDESRSITIGVNAADPAIEKALRGLGIVAQEAVRNPVTGKPDPAELQRRLNKALTLINDAIQHNSASPEAASDMTSMNHRVGYNQVFVDQVLEKHKDFLSFLETRQAEMENVDMMEAVTRLQDDARALEISYQTLARVHELSLVNYL